MIGRFDAVPESALPPLRSPVPPDPEPGLRRDVTDIDRELLAFETDIPDTPLPRRARGPSESGSLDETGGLPGYGLDVVDR